MRLDTEKKRQRFLKYLRRVFVLVAVFQLCVIGMCAKHGDIGGAVSNAISFAVMSSSMTYIYTLRKTWSDVQHRFPEIEIPNF